MPTDSNSNKSQVIPYSEYMLTLNGESALTGDEQSAVDQALVNNSAVGVAMGAYDEQLTLSMASNLFVKNLGYSYDDFSGEGAHSFLDFVTEEDRGLFTAPEFATFEGNFKFRMQSKTGERVYAYAYKTDAVNAAGEKQWVISVRVNRETKTLHQFMRGLTHLVVRYAICDLEASTYSFYVCEPNGHDMALGVYDSFTAGMVDQLHIASELEGLTQAFEPANIREQLTINENLYRYDYAADGENLYYRLSVMPIEYENGTLVRYLVLVMDVTEAHRIDMRTKLALEEACLAAERANQAKTNFLSSMSHDIRTPMNAIIGMTAIATAHIDDQERVLDSLGKITTSSRHLLGLINEILDMSRIERGKMVLNEEDFSLPELVDNMVAMVKPQLASREQSFEVRVHDVEHEQVIGDSLRIQQVFTNIVGNAIKYTPVGGTIALDISEKATQHANIACYEFIVEDNGIGMEPEFIEHIFEPFARANNASTSGAQGTGLGMPISRNIVNMMNGDIKVESELGQGTRVSITVFLRLQDQLDSEAVHLANLPVLVVDDDRLSCESTVDTLQSIGMQGEWVDNGPAAVERVDERHQAADDFYAVILDWKMPGMDGIETARAIRKRVGEETPIIMLTSYDFTEIEAKAREAGITCFVTKPLFRSRLEQVFKRLTGGDSTVKVKSETAAPSVAKPAANFAGKRVLVVEDNMLNREIMVDILTETGVEVETAVNGKIAVDMVAEAPEAYYDLVFMDIQMPVMNGYEATSAIRSLPNGKGALLPIVALTANAFAEDVVMAKNAGVNEHLAKPVNIDQLNKTMQTWMG